MVIDLDLLFLYGAINKKYLKNEIVVEEGDEARNYFQIVEGTVKMYNITESGKEFIQGFFNSGDSFGEPPLFIQELYPASAMCVTNAVLIKLPKEKFFELLLNHPGCQFSFLTLFAKRIYAKSITAKEITHHSPEMRILGFLTAYKKKHSAFNERVLIPYTRQDIANITGLRVETVIRTLSKMKETHKVDIINKKLFF